MCTGILFIDLFSEIRVASAPVKLEWPILGYVKDVADKDADEQCFILSFYFWTHWTNTFVLHIPLLCLNEILLMSGVIFWQNFFLDTDLFPLTPLSFLFLPVP